jgi:hypothetical protein
MEILVLVASIIGTGHFALSLLLWACLVRLALSLGDDVDWSTFGYAIPTVVLLPLFASCTVLAWRRRKCARVVLAAGLVLSIGFFVFDATNHNWQVHAENYHGENTGPTFHYYNWWWYDQSWFH